MNAYSYIVKFGRVIEGSGYVVEMAKEQPGIILAAVEQMENKLRWTDIDAFFTAFPPIKHYDEDGFWTYKSAMEWREETFGERFGKGDFKHILMTHCYENPYLQAVSMAWMMAVSEINKRQGGISAAEQFLNSLGNTEE